MTPLEEVESKTNLMQTLKAALVAFVIGAICGLLLMGYLRRPKPTVYVKDQPAAEIKLPDGSVVAQVVPTATPPPKIKIVTKEVEVVRTVTVEVKPDKSDCPPIDFTMKLLKNDDGTLRVLVSAQGGTITKSMDIPVEGRTIIVEPKQITIPKNSVGLIYEKATQDRISKGIYYDRDLFSTIRVGVEMSRDTYSAINRQSTGVRLKLGINF